MPKVNLAALKKSLQGNPQEPKKEPTKKETQKLENLPAPIEEKGNPPEEPLDVSIDEATELNNDILKGKGSGEKKYNSKKEVEALNNKYLELNGDIFKIQQQINDLLKRKQTYNITHTEITNFTIWAKKQDPAKYPNERQLINQIRSVGKSAIMEDVLNLFDEYLKQIGGNSTE